MGEGPQNNDFLILVVDDEFEVRQNSMLKLKANGFNVVTAESGSEALDICSKQHVSIGIIDYFMPEMTGEELIKKIRETNKEMVLILQTAHSGEKPKMEMLELLDIQSYHDKAEGPHGMLEKAINAKKSCIQIREIKRLQEEILANKVKLSELGFLIGGIAHNLKSPVGALVTGIELAQHFKLDMDDLIKAQSIENKAEYEEHSKDLGRALEIAFNKSQYMCDILRTIRNQAFPETVSSNNFKVIDVITRVTRLIDCDLKERGFIWEKNINVSNDLKIHGSVINLVQVIINLIINAMEAYEGEKGKIILTCAYESDGKIIISVQDFGKGVPNAVADKLFGTAVTTKREGNDGVGLYIAYRTITKEFEGVLRFETTQNGGTTFYIELPIYGQRAE